MNKLSCYIVGAGFMGSTHLDCYKKDDRVEVIGIIDIDESRGRKLAEENGVIWFSDLDSAFKERKADFVDVCLPSFLHKNSVVRAMELGADVVCEKPFAIDIEDIDAMISASERLNRRLMVAHVCRFMPQYYKAKEILDSGILGKPLAFECFRESETPLWSWNSWLFDKKKSGGTLLDLSIHDLDISNWLFGKPEYHKVILAGEKDRPFVNLSHSTMFYGNGVVSHVTANHLLVAGHPFETSFKLICSKGSAEFSSAVNPSLLVVYREGAKEEIPLDSLKGFEDPYGFELESFVSALISGEEFRISPEEAKLAVKTVHKLYENMDSSLC